MFNHLQIYEPSERRLVGLADLATRPLRWFRRAPQQAPIRRVLLLRLERIGDLLMVLDAIADARVLWPEAEIDLAVGSWNLPIAKLIPNIDQIQVADVPWLARDREGDSPGTLIRRARAWRQRRYDLVINFEPDVRSNLLAWLTGARQRVGYWTGGGGAFLTDASAYQPMTHVSVNARQLIARAASRALESRATAWPRLVPPRDAVARADALLAGRRRPFVGVHASGGRPSKQWHLDRFAAVARTLAETRGATIVLTGAPSDRQLVDEVRRRLPGIPIVDASVDLDLATLAALLQRLDLLITGDTGPMHLAAAMDTPVVALFGPSHPERYGPMGRRQRIIRIDLPCSPCGRVRLPPERCRGHVPDCLDGISVDMVVAAAADLLDEASAA